MVFERALPRRHSLLSALALTALATVTFAGPADARRDRYYGYDNYYEPEREQEAAEPAEQPKLDRPVGQPRLAVVSLGDQRVTIYDANGQIMQGSISSGATPNDTPPGIYAILQKNREHYSNRYDDARMPFMQRITWTGMALHGGVLPGYPASHGCIRLNESFANQLFDMTKLGMRVVVSRNNMAPSDISHPLLFKPAPFRDNVAMLSPAAVSVLNASEGGNDTRYSGGGQNDPPELATRTAALQAIMTSKAAEAEELGKKADAARLEAKQKQRESAKAAKALRTAENAYKGAQEWLADAEKDLASATKDNKEKAIKRAEEQKAKATAKIAEAKAKLDAVTAETGPALEAAKKAADVAKAAEDEKATAAAAARDAERKLSPVSVFISLKTKKLYIRQAMEQIYEGDVTIRDPDAPIGTHIFTAVDYKPGGHDMRWNVVSIAGRQPGEPEKSSGMNKHARNAIVESIPTDVNAAQAALGRIEIPQETMEKISELVLPGSSLIVSDEAAHKETGKATDFIVLISGEPQGGIILRPKPRNEYYDDFYGGGFGPWGYDNRGYDGYDRRRRRGPSGPFGGQFKWW